MAPMAACGRLEEPNADSSLPDVGMHAPSQSVPTKIIETEDTTEYHCDRKDVMQSRTCPPTVLGDQALQDCGLEIEIAVEPRSVDVVASDAKKDRFAGRPVKPDRDDSAVAVQPTTSKNAGSGSSIRGIEKSEQSRVTCLLKHPMFEIAFAGWIFINAVTMGLEQQFVGFDTGSFHSHGGMPPRRQDLTISMLASFHAEALEVLANKTGSVVTSFNDGIVKLKEMHAPPPKPIVNKLRKLDLAYKVARHLSSALLDDTIAEMKNLILPVTKDTMSQKDASPNDSIPIPTDNNQELKDRIACLEAQIQEVLAGKVLLAEPAAHFVDGSDIPSEHKITKPEQTKESKIADGNVLNEEIPTAQKQLTLVEAWARVEERRQLAEIKRIAQAIIDDQQAFHVSLLETTTAFSLSIGSITKQ
eukprot:TRINITY_DN29198_c0_g1_i3.p1 TRINITY_DN29198_c0_g1~~TRINITY_DN29198_c0_g1_i3.p1  ORF type:complete len:416 (-),score=71.45 TRINITY_DN29198_c0_g1_i3:681-1928(-)